MKRAYSKGLAAAAVCVLMTGTATVRAADKFTADWESLKQRNPAPEWFRDAKFGIYFHWGVYSVPAFGSEWYPRNMHLKGRRENQHHIKTYGEPTEFGYHDFVPKFKAEKFNAGRAALHGKGIGTESKDGGKKNVGFWDDPAACVTWEVNFPKAGTYNVSGRFAATGKGAFLIEAGGGRLAGKPPVTGDWEKFETVAVGTVEVTEAGKQVVKIGRDPNAGWKAINMTFLEFSAK